VTVLDPATPLDQPLSTAMREGSKTEHEAAENSSFMSELLAGRVSEAGYAAYLLRLRAVYEVMEATGRALADDPVVAAVHDPGLERLAAIDADLDHWAPGAVRGVDSPATAAYVARLAASATWGGLFVAHHYTRYLGDLSGGQAIGRILDREFGLGGRGIAFYDFPAVPKPKPYKDAYRARLDALAASPEDKGRVVAEVQEAFRLNRGLFAELGASLPQWRR
jgi:heme oxygenase (biliverdin-producing, ferredoxin)